MRCDVSIRPIRSLISARIAVAGQWRFTSTSTKLNESKIRGKGLGKEVTDHGASKEAGQGMLSERAMQDQKNLLEEFGLLKVPSTDGAQTGARINEMGQLEIIDKVESQRPHKTALMLSRAPNSLTERDFLRILTPSKHLEGWRSRGGLEQIIPIRNVKTLERTNSWVLLFATTASAEEYQVKAHRLRQLLRMHIPQNPASGLSMPFNYTVRGSFGFTLQDYALSTPWQYPLLTAEISPFGSWVRNAIKIQESITAPSIDHDYESSSTSREPKSNSASMTYPVRVSLSRHSLLRPTKRLLESFLSWDARERCVPWDLAEGEDSIVLLSKTPSAETGTHHDGGNGERALVDQQTGMKQPRYGELDVSNWRISFRTASDARRFVRVWHMRDFPQVHEYQHCDPPAVVKAEELFWDDSF